MDVRLLTWVSRTRKKNVVQTRALLEMQTDVRERERGGTEGDKIFRSQNEGAKSSAKA
jgi:hypothetical protein